MEFLSQTYIALRGPTGAPQSASETIARLADRLSPATLLADRRAAVLALKGLARTHGADVAAHALPGLLDVLQNDAEIDADIARAVLETLNALCACDEEHTGVGATEREVAARHVEAVLKDARAVHVVLALLADTAFYTRLAALHLLATLLQERRHTVQGYFLTASAGPGSFVTLLEEKREIILNEALSVFQSLTAQSAEIQKILAFAGAFERLFNVLTSQGGLDGGAVVRDALKCIDCLLRYNGSNMSYFRNTPLPPVLLQLLGYPPSLPPDVPPPQGFALQLWDDAQKRANAALLVGVLGLLARGGTGAANMQDPLTFAVTRCLLELGLASNAPTAVKTQALRLLPADLAAFPLAQLPVTPYVPVPETNGEEWDRLEPAPALDTLVELVLHGEYGGVLEGEQRPREGMELRAAALSVFQNFVQREEIAEAFVQAMAAPPASGAPPTPLLDALTALHSAPLRPRAVAATHIAALLFAHLLRASPRAKALARGIVPSTVPPSASTNSFFVPADGGPPPQTEDDKEEDEADGPQTLLQILAEHLSLAFLARAREDTPDREAREWDRLLVGYLTLLSQWLWEDPPAVRALLEAGAMSVLVEPINQSADTDALIPGLCVFLLGVCYEFNREPGEITRSTIYPILTRLGVDTLAGRLVRLRDDERFKAVGPDTLVLTTQHPQAPAPVGPHSHPQEAEEGEIWFDWAFVDFWKSNYYTLQKGIAASPNALSSTGQGDTTMLIASLKDVIRNQAAEIDSLRTQLQTLTQAAQRPDDREELQEKVATLTTSLQGAEEKRREVEKEQEDLLVLLDELNSKRRRDKARMREAGMEISEDEGEEDDAGDGEEE